MERMLFIETPVGKLGITASDEAVTRIFFGREYRNRRRPRNAPETCTPETAGPLLLQAAAELAEYFAGTRREFTLPLAPAGTPFQQAVWEALRTIPYGETRTYGQIAAQIGRPTACRAVGMANNRNPIAIVVPCHRVVGSDGRTGRLCRRSGRQDPPAESRKSPRRLTARRPRTTAGDRPQEAHKTASAGQLKRRQARRHCAGKNSSARKEGGIRRRCRPLFPFTAGQSPNAKALMPS